MWKKVTNNELETIRLGQKIAGQLKRGDILALSGDLGTGKTAFVKGIARGLGIDDYITSPTFTLVHSYEGMGFNLHHFDVYRVSDEEELFEIGFEEYLYENDICVIEWADLIKNLIPNHSIWIHFERLDGGRTITVKGLEEK